jgi:hypothetical protein
VIDFAPMPSVMLEPGQRLRDEAFFRRDVLCFVGAAQSSQRALVELRSIALERRVFG